MPWCEERVEVEPGALVAGLGLLLVRESLAEELPRELEVRLAGEALVRGLLCAERVALRPFSARLAPWLADLWSAPLEPHGEASRGARLRGVRWFAPRREGALARPGPLALWCGVRARAEGDGEGALAMEVRGAGLCARREVRLCVRRAARYWRGAWVLAGAPRGWRSLAGAVLDRVAQGAGLEGVRLGARGTARQWRAEGPALWAGLEPWDEGDGEPCARLWCVVGPLEAGAEEVLEGAFQALRAGVPEGARRGAREAWERGWARPGCGRVIDTLGAYG